MMFRVITTSLLISSFLTSSFSPLRAVYDNLEQIQGDLPFICKHNGAIQTSLDFKASAQTSAGCFNYAQKDGEIYVLLGLRDDENTWCTPGGGSKESEKTLAQTASQEGGEESLNIYAPHPDSLRLKPFVDLASDGKLFRLYFNKVEFLDADVFNKRLAFASSAALKPEFKEFHKYLWAPVKSLFDALTQGLSTFTIGEETITLFDPLYQVLTTRTGKELLEHLATNKKIPLEQSLRNRLHVAGTPDVQHSFKKHWKLPDFDPKDLSFIPFDGDAFGRKNAQVSEILENSPIKIRLHAFDPKKNEKIFGQAVAFKAAANLELKKALQGEGRLSQKLKTHLARFNPSPAPEQRPRTVSWNPEKTLSDRLLQFQLGEAYVAPAEDTPKARKIADIANLRKIFGCQNDRDFEAIATLMEIERRHKDWIPLIHATRPEIGFLAYVGTNLRELLTLHPFPPGLVPGLRIADIYFKDHTSMAKSIELTGLGDYANGNQNRRLSANMAFTAGSGPTNSSTSSILYFMDAMSTNAPDPLKCFEEALPGVREVSYTPYQALYEQFYANLGGDVSQSVLLLLLINPDILDQYAYMSFGGGAEYFYADATNIPQYPTPVEAYQLADQELNEKSKEGAKPHEKLAKHITEVHLLLHPGIMYDPTQVQVHAQERFPLEPQKKQTLQQKLRELFAYDFGTWLSQHIQLMPDSFTGNVVLKELYFYAYEGLTGQDIRKEEKLTAEAFLHLVRNDHAEGVRMYLKHYPDLVHQLVPHPKSLFSIAIQTGDGVLAKFIIEDFLKTTLQKLFTSTDVLDFLTLACESGSAKLDALSYILQNYDMALISEPRRRKFAEEALHSFEVRAEVLDFIDTHIFPLTLDFVDDVIKRSKREPWGLASLAHIPPLAVADILLQNMATEKEAKKPRNLTLILEQQIIRQNLYPTNFIPSTGEPLFFHLLHCPHASMINGTLQNNPAILDLKNKEELTPYQYVQKCLLKGRPIANSHLFHLREAMVQNNRIYCEEAYRPWLEKFGEAEDFPSFLTENFTSIQKQTLAEAEEGHELRKLLLNNPSAFIEKAKEEKITPQHVQQYFRDSYFKDDQLDLVKETLPHIYKDSQDLLKIIDKYWMPVCFYSTQPKIFEVVLKYIGADALLKSVTPSDLDSYFSVLLRGGLLPDIEQAFPDLITYQDPNRDLFPYFLKYGEPRTLDFAKKHLQRLKETMDEEMGWPLLFTTFINNKKSMEALIEFDSSILDLPTTDGLTLKDDILLNQAEDLSHY